MCGRYTYVNRKKLIMRAIFYSFWNVAAKQVNESSVTFSVKIRDVKFSGTISVPSKLKVTLSPSWAAKKKEPAASGTNVIKLTLNELLKWYFHVGFQPQTNQLWFVQIVLLSHWLNWQCGCFRNQGYAVWIQSSEKFTLNICLLSIVLKRRK